MISTIAAAVRPIGATLQCSSHFGGPSTSFSVAKSQEFHIDDRTIKWWHSQTVKNTKNLKILKH